MIILFWVVLILFTIVKTKIVHYSSLCYFPLTFLAAHFTYYVINKKANINRLQKILIIITGIFYIILSISLPIINHFKESIIGSGKIKDDFIIGSLQSEVNWTGYETLISICIITGLFLFIWFLKKDKPVISLYSIYLFTLLFTFLLLIFIAPKIEKYSQNAAIEFYKSKLDEDCYIEPLGFKSYAHLFYSKKRIPTNLKSHDKQWLLKGKIDKPAYFVTKINKKTREMEKYPKLEVLYEKNGFVFLVRFPEGKY